MAISTFSPSNSSIHEWLKFNYTSLPEHFACSDHSTNNSCRQVCDDGLSLFHDQPTNLVTCGMWTRLVIATSDYDAKGTPIPNNDTTVQSLYSAFNDVDLRASDLQNVSIYADVISNCFQRIYSSVRRFSFAHDNNAASACTSQNLFPSGRLQNWSSLTDCVQAICSPVTLNPDLAGIGVSPQKSH